MAQMAKSPLSLLPGAGVTPEKIPRIMKEIMAMTPGLALPERRAHHYPRAVKKEAATLSVAASFKGLNDKHYGIAHHFL